jgi:hypothetical protein
MEKRYPVIKDWISNPGHGQAIEPNNLVRVRKLVRDVVSRLPVRGDVQNIRRSSKEDYGGPYPGSLFVVCFLSSSLYPSRTTWQSKHSFTLDLHPLKINNMENFSEVKHAGCTGTPG